MPEKLLTSGQVAQILQVHPLTVLKYIKAGKLKGIKLGRVWRFREKDVEQFLEDRSMALNPSKTDEQIIQVENTLDHYIL
ncbi:helix-turn-helix domain-containing protein [Candidatus Peregrinibacteria bacterium]|nr:helix-turn-helix domain-containing protein [Candidatus Peregrinibacteria bacterium]